MLHREKKCGLVPAIALFAIDARRDASANLVQVSEDHRVMQFAPAEWVRIHSKLQEQSNRFPITTLSGVDDRRIVSVVFKVRSGSMLKEVTQHLRFPF